MATKWPFMKNSSGTSKFSGKVHHGFPLTAFISISSTPAFSWTTYHVVLARYSREECAWKPLPFCTLSWMILMCVIFVLVSYNFVYSSLFIWERILLCTQYVVSLTPIFAVRQRDPEFLIFLLPPPKHGDHRFLALQFFRTKSSILFLLHLYFPSNS